MNACKKGKRGEREWAEMVRARGYDCRRGQQHAGGPDSPDVVSLDLGFIHFEVKRTESLSLYEAVGQAIKDCGGAIPVVAHKRNGKEWLCVVRAEDFFEMVKHRAFLEKIRRERSK